MTEATPVKLRSGEWGARVPGKARRGQRIRIVTRSGKSWSATVRNVVWSGPSWTLVATQKREHAREMCANCYDRPAVTEAVDSSGIPGPVCSTCAGEGQWGLSFG